MRIEVKGKNLKLNFKKTTILLPLPCPELLEISKEELNHRCNLRENLFPTISMAEQILDQCLVDVEYLNLGTYRLPKMIIDYKSYLVAAEVLEDSIAVRKYNESRLIDSQIIITIRHEVHMLLAYILSTLGVGHTKSNPLVGAIITYEDHIASWGAHLNYGSLHGEAMAIKNCDHKLGHLLKSSKLYVTLEPCCHQGKQPPCSKLIIEKKLTSVIISLIDPNKKVAGKGMRLLKEAKIQVTDNVLGSLGKDVNRIFLHNHEKNRSFIAMKYAMTLDGRIATDSGHSKWISGDLALRHTHRLRNLYSHILIGAGTASMDNPKLNCRLESGLSPVPIICSGSLNLSEELYLIRNSKVSHTHIATVAPEYLPRSMKAPHEKKILNLRANGCTMILCKPSKHSDKFIPSLADLLYKLSISDYPPTSILVEGGSHIHGMLVCEGLADYCHIHIGSKLVSGLTAKLPVSGPPILDMGTALTLSSMTSRTMETDIIVEGHIG